MRPASITELQSIVRECPRLQAVGGGSKPGLSTLREGTTAVELAGLSGILEYQPEEYTFTALAGTPLTVVDQALAEHGQYLPFDPVLVEAGATLGGTVASGLSGPGRYRYGGVRDFLLAVQFIDGEGQAVRGGGKVVKNSAGFDLPKLMAGSLGAYGALTELTIKVFPRPEAYLTLQADFPSLAEAIDNLARLSRAPLDLFALELVPLQSGTRLQVRLGGEPGLFAQRAGRVQALLGGGEPLTGPEEAELWREAREFRWLAPGAALVKAPVTPGSLVSLEAKLAERGARRRYSVAANLAWIGWPGPLAELDTILSALGLPGLAVWKESGPARLGARVGESFAHRVKRALDPQGRWVEV
jgi:glycolate oxidase FAD binding subunit